MSGRTDASIELREVLGAPARQTAFVVRDIDASMKAWADTLDIGPWSSYTLGPPRLRNMIYRGEQTSFTFRHALVMSGGMQLELVQPVEGPSIFTDQLDTSGEGMHHLGFVVPDHAAASGLLIQRGFTPLQSAEGFGLDGSGRFAYFEPPAGVGTIIELIDPPKVRAEPETVYPAPVDQRGHVNQGVQS
jgi:methylmalonyl-CoA/ethylmalonyl-CoA epimerase